MPARWIDLLLRINHVIDDADADLSESERNLFFAHLFATATQRENRRVPAPCQHPIPGPVSHEHRSVAGD